MRGRGLSCGSFNLPTSLAEQLSGEMEILLIWEQFPSLKLTQLLFSVESKSIIHHHSHYAMPTKTVEVLQLQDQGRKMLLDSVLTTHERVVQISGLSATFAEIFLEIIQSNLPEGVKLSVKEHTEEDFKGRFKARPELEELLAKLN
uniref:Mitochondrial ribosomal protein L48 n=1 Tax=Phocoena sinus TaxID=42100 RepID=A0A8C9BL53_PHOSS